MTPQPPTDAARVTQEDREAAAEINRLTSPAFADATAAGRHDDGLLVQAFTRHRLAERERCALIADDGHNNAGDESEQRMARGIAAAIRETNDVG